MSQRLRLPLTAMCVFFMVCVSPARESSLNEPLPDPRDTVSPGSRSLSIAVVDCLSHSIVITYARVSSAARLTASVPVFCFSICLLVW